MAFIKTTHPDDAVGELRTMYEGQQGKYGYVPNYAKVFSDRPEIMGLWAALLSGIRRNIDPRQFELCTLAAAQALGSSYCTLAHGKALTEFFSPEEVRSMVDEPDAGSLNAAEAAMMRIAAKVARASSSVTPQDVNELKTHGFSDRDVFDIVVVAAARAFFANLVEGLGAQADAAFLDMDERLRSALTIGRPIDADEAERIADF